VATKFTPTPWRTTVDSVVDACEQSRRRLGVDQIDLYQLHMPDIVQPFSFLGLKKSKDEVYWKGIAECYRLGLVKNVGVSNYGPTLVEKCQDTLAKYDVPLASNQIAYSLIGRQNGAQDTVDKCSDLGVKVLAYYPFAMGLLTGKYSSSIESIPDSMITSLTSSKKTSLEMKDLQKYASKMSSLLSVMETIAKERNKTIAQVALNYIICKGAIPIPGSRSIDQVKDNIGAMDWRLTETEINMLEAEADALDHFEGAGFKRTSEKFVGYGVEKWSLD
jgi:pyridoxine 4-dehydrogenase